MSRSSTTVPGYRFSLYRQDSNRGSQDDECVCGEPRRQHDGGAGACSENRYGGHGDSGPCNRFVLGRRAR